MFPGGGDIQNPIFRQGKKDKKEPLELILATSRSISAPYRPYSSDGTPNLRAIVSGKSITILGARRRARPRIGMWPRQLHKRGNRPKVQLILSEKLGRDLLQNQDFWVFEDFLAIFWHLSFVHWNLMVRVCCFPTDRLDDALQPKIEALKSLMEKLQEPLAGWNHEMRMRMRGSVLVNRGDTGSNGTILLSTQAIITDEEEVGKS